MDFSVFEKMVRGGQSEADVLGAAIDFVCELYLEDPGAPEESKIELRILKELKKLDSLARKYSDYATPEINRERLKRLYPLRKDVLEYLTLVNAGMQAFVNDHPIPSKDGA